MLNVPEKSLLVISAETLHFFDWVLSTNKNEPNYNVILNFAPKIV